MVEVKENILKFNAKHIILFNMTGNNNLTKENTLKTIKGKVFSDAFIGTVRNYDLTKTKEEY